MSNERVCDACRRVMKDKTSKEFHFNSQLTGRGQVVDHTIKIELQAVYDTDICDKCLLSTLYSEIYKKIK